MARVPITIMGFRCERCGHEWIPRGGVEVEPKVCPSPACKSPYWNKPRKSATTYEAFSKAIAATLKQTDHSLTWTEIRTAAHLPQAFPNNKWVRQMEKDIGVKRERDTHGIIHWRLESLPTNAKAAQTPDAKTKRAGRK